MSTFVLIHGAWHGGWAWDKVAGSLRGQGHTVHAPDLPGHGKDHTPVQQVTLQKYAQRVVEVLEECAEPVILVGHSMGGIVVSRAAEQRPDKVRWLVYLCAFLVQDGQTLLQWAEPDADALILRNLVFSANKLSATIKPEVLKQALYADCSAEDYKRAISLLVPQAAAPLGTPLHLTKANYGRIPLFYVECLQDRAISISVQRKMYKAAGCEHVFSLDCSHSPFLSAPGEVVDCLLAATQSKDRAVAR